ncbi:unnamed protein product [Lepeophtheirus salmonis]|uniref:(salmon louse) hypothetical protein n=1 Tax=Lepeophtheirus salmonis TaxID=72036 RepID=A0A7R8CW74_LEPSM|nr:unnamed protein product [Lepeophtheirus salmonis]CAF2949861.1 unnamed protein product [Lepeophtheirus salmonis]
MSLSAPGDIRKASPSPSLLLSGLPYPFHRTYPISLITSVNTRRGCLWNSYRESISPIESSSAVTMKYPFLHQFPGLCQGFKTRKLYDVRVGFRFCLSCPKEVRLE